MSYQVCLQHVFSFNCTFANKTASSGCFEKMLSKLVHMGTIVKYTFYLFLIIACPNLYYMLNMNRFLVYNINQAINKYQRSTKHKIYQYLLLLAFYLLISKKIYYLSTCIIYFSRLIDSNDLSQSRTKFTLCNIGVFFCYAMLYCHASNGMCCI